MAIETVQLVISGCVQGVFYRAWTKAQAERLQLDGWVRNRRDGSVEALFSGRAENVKLMIERCGDGPPDAQVDKAEIVQRGGAVPRGFEIRETC